MKPGFTVITSVALCPDPPCTIVTAALPEASIVMLNDCPVPDPALDPVMSLYVPAVLSESAADILPTVAATPVTALSVAKSVTPDPLCDLGAGPCWV